MLKPLDFHIPIGSKKKINDCPPDLVAVLFGIKATDRVKSFLFRFIAVPAKWIKTARQYKLNIFSNKPYNLIWEHG